MVEFSEFTERARAGLTEVVLQTVEEFPEITQSLISRVTLASQSQISRYINGEQTMPVTFVIALKEDPRTRPLAIAIMRYVAGFLFEIREKPTGETNHEPISHELLALDIAKADYIRSIDDHRPAAAMKALDAMDKLVWSLRLKTADKNLRKVK